MGLINVEIVKSSERKHLNWTHPITAFDQKICISHLEIDHIETSVQSDNWQSVVSKIFEEIVKKSIIVGKFVNCRFAIYYFFKYLLGTWSKFDDEL